MSYTEDLSNTFLQKVLDFSAERRCKPEHLLKVWFSESKGLHAEAVHVNPKTGAREAFGINQAIPDTLKGYGWTGDPEDYVKLSAEQQFDYATKQYPAKFNGKLTSAGMIYLANFLPNKVTSPPPDGVAARKGEPAYNINSWLDYNGDDTITVQDLEDLANAGTTNTKDDPYGDGWSLRDRWLEILGRIKAPIPPSTFIKPKAGGVSLHELQASKVVRAYKLP